jgi:hypothetical protein
MPEGFQRARESQRSDTTSSTINSTDKLLDKERKIRSNAPSPELAMSRVEVGSAKPTLLSDVRPTAKTAKQRVLQPLSNNVATGSPANTGKSSGTATRKQEKMGDTKQERKQDTRRLAQSTNAKSRQPAKAARKSNPRNDSDWTAFVEQRMSGMAVKGGN